MASERESTAPSCEFVSPNLAYSEETFKLVRELAPTIKRYSYQNGVPPIAVAGSIADEFNTRSGFRTVVDWFQDDVLLNWMPSMFIRVDVKLGFNTKLLNATKHDIGVGNIKLETGMAIFQRYRGKFRGNLSDWSELVDYIRSKEGTVHIASLVIRRAQELLGPYITGYPDDLREAVLVTYYKQGDAYVHRFLNQPAAKAADTVKYIRPGEGCRVLVQRERFKALLGIAS
jgi:hypothetical protein